MLPYVIGDLAADRLRNFFTFDLSEITGTVVTAELQLTRFNVGELHRPQRLLLPTRSPQLPGFGWLGTHRTRGDRSKADSGLVTNRYRLS